MEQQEIIQGVAGKIKEIFSKELSGHSWLHIERVWKMAKRIGEDEGADLFTVELVALLHDISDYKLNNGDDESGLNKVKEILGDYEISEEKISEIQETIKRVGYRGGHNLPMESVEGKCVQDADRLEAIGAIGIARCFYFGGHKGNPIYDPENPPKENQTIEEYKKANSPQINHFYEKLLLLKDKMNTKLGKELAQGRHEFMENYLKQFFEEMEGKR